MSFQWMLVVLVAAALHASWNAIIKAGSKKFADTVLVTIGAAIIPALLLPWIPLPAAPSWPYLVASVIIHFGYFSLVALAYKSGDLSYAYPIMRGIAPLLTALIAGVVLNEPLTSGGKIGIVNAGSYISWLFFLIAFPFLALSLLREPQLFTDHIRSRWRTGLLGGFCTFCSYGLILWAMIHLPIALVAALRETSVIFGTVIAAVFLRERFGSIRYLAAGLVTAGAVAMKAF